MYQRGKTLQEWAHMYEYQILWYIQQMLKQGDTASSVGTQINRFSNGKVCGGH